MPSKDHGLYLLRTLRFMASSIGWYLHNAGQVVTGLLGANLPSGMFWEEVFPLYDPRSNSFWQFLEGVIAITGHTMTAALLSETLNPILDDYTMTSIYLLHAPYFLPQSLRKLRRWSRAIRDEINLYVRPPKIRIHIPIASDPTDEPLRPDDTNPGLQPLPPPVVDSVPVGGGGDIFIDPNSGNIPNYDCIWQRDANGVCQAPVIEVSIDD